MSERLIILGVDGVDWRFVDEHRSELPTLAKWPVLSPLQTIFPPDSIPAWTTIFTGVPPGEHGKLDSIDYLGDRPAWGAEDAGSILPHQTFWDEAGRRGKRVCVVNPFLAYPSWDVNGVMISGPVFVTGDVSVTGAPVTELGTIPELGGIVTFPTAKTMGPFVDGTMKTTEDQVDLGMRMLERTDPDLFFMNILTVDRMQHFAWRFADPDDPTYPGPTSHADAILKIYRLVDDIARRFSEHGRVLMLSDHGHGRRCTRMVYFDEVLRRAGLLKESANGSRLRSKAYLLERGKRLAMEFVYRHELEVPGYALARRLPNRKALRLSSFSANEEASDAHLSRLFGRGQFGGIELRQDTSQTRADIRQILEGVRDPETKEPVIEWIRDREEVVNGARIDRYPPVVFKLREGYGVDFGMYGDLFAPDVNHRRVSGGHKELGVLASSFTMDSPPESIEEMYDCVLGLL